jgi:hypothetical protein
LLPLKKTRGGKERRKKPAHKVALWCKREKKKKKRKKEKPARR